MALEEVKSILLITIYLSGINANDCRRHLDCFSNSHCYNGQCVCNKGFEQYSGKLCVSITHNSTFAMIGIIYIVVAVIIFAVFVISMILGCYCYRKKSKITIPGRVIQIGQPVQFDGQIGQPAAYPSQNYPAYKPGAYNPVPQYPSQFQSQAL